MANPTHPTFISVGAMMKLMKRKRYAARASRGNGSRSVQMAEPVNADGASRPGPKYRWSSAQNGWVLRGS